MIFMVLLQPPRPGPQPQRCCSGSYSRTIGPSLQSPSPLAIGCYRTARPDWTAWPVRYASRETSARARLRLPCRWSRHRWCSEPTRSLKGARGWGLGRVVFSFFYNHDGLMSSAFRFVLETHFSVSWVWARGSELLSYFSRLPFNESRC